MDSKDYYTKIPNAIIRDKTLTSSEFKVLANIYSWIKDGHCWIYNAILAKDCGMTVRNLQMILSKLNGKYIKRVISTQSRNDKKANYYIILTHENGFTIPMKTASSINGENGFINPVKASSGIRCKGLHPRSKSREEKVEHTLPGQAEKACGAESMSPSYSCLSKAGLPSQLDKAKAWVALVNRIYEAYPKKVSRKSGIIAISQAWKRIMAEKNLDEIAAWRYLIDRVKLFAKSNVGISGRWCPIAKNWFDGERYLDDEAEWNRDNDDTFDRTVDIHSDGRKRDFITGLPKGE